MISTGTRSPAKMIVAVAALVALFCVANESPVSAQNWGGNIFSLGTFEGIFGPIIPPGGLGGSFRSEISAGLAATVFDKAMLGNSTTKFDLVSHDGADQLDEHPVRYDVKANVRFWRFGFRGAYLNLDSRGLDRFDFSGMTLGGDFDVVQYQWLAFGGSADFYFIDPTFTGVVFLQGVGLSQIEFKGDRPVTVGGYMRYVPPEMLGFPMHFEARVQVPYKKNTSLTSLGASLVFRPQVYRFDAFARLAIEKYYLKFDNLAQVQQPAPSQNWQMDMQWKAFVLELGVFF